MRRHGCWIALFLAFGLACVPLQAQDYKVDIGYTSLVQRLGGGTPTGAGVLVAQIEATDTSPDQNTFLPDPAELPGKTFNNISGGGGISGHATGAVGRFFYGDRGIAQGITTINNYRVDSFAPSTNGYIDSAQLLTLSPNVPLVQSARVESHAYAGFVDNFGPVDTDILRRVDFMIKRDQIVVIAATNNNTAPPDALLASAYNVISVGINPIPRGDPAPQSSVGPTVGEVAGRSKPDIVVPADALQQFPSNSTAILAGASALLVETANGISPNARRVETIKSVLLTGATTEEFNVLAQPWTRIHNGTFREPLDRRWGAGELNIDNSHRILTQPEQNASNSTTVNRFGWDHNTISQGQTHRYFIDITQTSTASVTAVWLRNIDVTPNGGNALILTPTLANIDIRLSTATGFTVGTLVDESVSPVDNVEHILASGLAPGRYVIEVTSNAMENFTISWDLRALAVPEPAALGLLGLLGAAGLVYAYRRQVKSLSQPATAQPTPQEVNSNHLHEESRA
jgi:hypothetical protein